mgnify:CR=1 FL=1
MPPSVACALVETSTGNHRPCGRSCAFSASSTTPGLDHGGGALAVDRDDAVEILRVVDDERRAHRLPALRAAGAARRGSGRLLPPRSASRSCASCSVLGSDHADGIDLVDRRVGRVAPAARGVEEHFALDLAGEALREGAVARPRVRDAGATFAGARSIRLRRPWIPSRLRASPRAGLRAAAPLDRDLPVEDEEGHAAHTHGARLLLFLRDGAAQRLVGERPLRRP